MIEEYANKVLIDPSLILAQNSIYYTFKSILELSKSHEKFMFYYPRSFKRLITKLESPEETSSIKFFLHGAYLSDPAELNHLMEAFSNVFFEFGPTPGQTEKYTNVRDALLKELKYRGELYEEELLDTLFEEWIFLQEHSCLVSRIKKPFNRFIAAGTVCIQFSRTAFDTLVRGTLREKRNTPISNIHRLRAMGKWVAVGVAAPTLASINPYFGGAAAVILLFDPT